MRKVQVGSRVALLNQVGEGVVTGINKDKRFLVLINDFEIPYHESELIVVGETTEFQSADSSLTADRKSKLENALYLAFTLSGNKGDAPLISFKLMNTLGHAISFVLYKEIDKKFKLEDKGVINENSSMSLHTRLLSDYLSIDRYFIQLQPFENNPQSPPLSWSGFIKHQAPELIEPSSWPMVDELSERAFTIQIFPTRKKVGKSSDPSSGNQNHNLLKIKDEWLLNPGRDGRYEVDLHIEELLENTAGMDNAEIIRYQLKHFEKCMDEAKSRPVKRFIIIHGVGKGVLRDEIRKILAEENIEHYDAPISKYGYGATEVILR